MIAAEPEPPITPPSDCPIWLALQDMGFGLISLKPRDKTPLIPWRAYQSGAHRAATLRYGTELHQTPISVLSRGRSAALSSSISTTTTPLPRQNVAGYLTR